MEMPVNISTQYSGDLQQEHKMKKGISLLGLIAIGAGLNVGAAIFLTPPVMVRTAGSALVFARILAALPVLLAIPSFMLIGSAYPTNGGQYRYSKLFSVPLAVGIYWVYFIGNLFGMAFMSLGTGTYLKQIFPSISITTSSLLMLTLFFVLNILGVKISSWVEIGLTGATILAILVFIVPGLTAVSASNLIPVSPKGLLGVFTVAAITFNICGGALNQFSVGKETKNAHKNMKLVVPISIILVVVLSALVELVAYGSIGWEALAAGNTLVPAARSFIPFAGLLFFFSIAGPFFASSSTIHALFTTVTREWMVGGEDGIIPKFFSKVNSKFGTPHWAIITMFIASAIILFLNPSIQVLSAMLTVGMMATFVLITLAGCTLEKRYPDLYKKSLYKPRKTILWISSLISVILTCVFIVVALSSLKWWSIIYLALVVIGVLFTQFRKKKNPLQALDSME